ncbi:hypothetical protein GGTG_04600 [Gaeumannomyces tritici R3-111a-1]|uniref:Uncharacterized protein n=1 Tax=Gaeumannomyces tritici (strain R3-111a-1) TaxID=644352 RepID=J3NTK0_GAET3|nr:hypothetical protein GGTG_04600 [Gaeumannomyces tritici R3-111a-1]EJT79515.1 hypothetical protein GGTG_04600 [Gaeumannomyces tritici R3-111a-1]
MRRHVDRLPTYEEGHGPCVPSRLPAASTLQRNDWPTSRRLMSAHGGHGTDSKPWPVAEALRRGRPTRRGTSESSTDETMT